MTTLPQGEHIAVTIHKQLLDPRAAGYFLVWAVWRLLVSSTVIWAGFAILVPWVGVTWYGVLIVLIMLNHLNWGKLDAAIESANQSLRAERPVTTRKKGERATKNDNELLAKRVVI